MVRKLLLTILAVSACMGSLHAADGYERMYRNLQKKVTVDFVDTKITDCIDVVASVTGVNIILHPRVRISNPVVNLKVTDMDAMALIRWITELTDTHADLKDQAIFITDKPDEKAADEERNALVLRAALAGVEAEVPPPGQPITHNDITKVALAIWEKENVKPQDFPGPNLSLGAAGVEITNPFAVPGN